MQHESFALTLTQNDIFLDQLRHHRSPLYNVGGYIEFNCVDTDRLGIAHERLVLENELFGLRIIRYQNGVFQGIVSDRTTALPVLDFSGKADPEKEANEWIRLLFATAIDVVDAELFRAYLLKISKSSFRYVGIAHHIAMDGWGFSNWACALCDLYNTQGGIGAIATTWHDVASDDVRYASSERYLADKAYWSRHIGDVPQAIFSARYKNFNGEPGGAPGRRKIIDISRTEFSELKSLAKSLGAGISHLFLAMLSVHFLHTSGHRRLAFGLPFHSRRTYAHKKMLGVFTSISPLCVDMTDRSCTFADLVKQISKQQLASLRHQRYPLGHIVRDLAGVGDRRSIYDVGFNYLQLSGEMKLGDSDAHLVYVSNDHEMSPLMVTLCECGDHGVVQLQLDYNLGYISENDILLISDRLISLMHSLHDVTSTCLDDISVIPRQELIRLIGGFGDLPLASASAECVHHLFESQVLLTPDAVAVAAGEQSLTYRDLNIRANRVAHCLMEHGVGTEVLVGICMERTADMVVAILGVLKSGGAYVPLDHNYPEQRIRAILDDSMAQFVLTQEHLSEIFLRPDIAVLTIERCLEGELDSANPDSSAIGVNASHLAYVIYTSGSTGKPKGVQIRHSNTVALLDWVRWAYTSEELSVVLASTSINFDLSIFEIFAPLMTGGRCLVVRDALEILEKKVEVSLINTVPSAMKVLLEQDAIPRGVRVVNLAGEPLPMNVVNELLSKSYCEKVINLYGPSEDTTYSTYAIFNDLISESPSIGRAISGTQLYVLSTDRRLVPMGSVGELYIAGSGVARGYLNAPDLTAERFVKNPFAELADDRFYKTGDLVRYDEHGALEYIGRIDDQVKIRGFRVEPGEIQRQLEQLDGVKTSVVLVRETASADKHLVAYVERWRKPASTGPDVSDEAWISGLRQALQAKLPSYMIPASILTLDEMPLTPNGKVDKKSLLAMHSPATPQYEYVAPQTSTEIRLSGMWGNLLGVDRSLIGATTSLFDFGGHSLLLVRLANDVRQDFDVGLSMHTFFQVSNLRDLAEKIDAEIIVQRMNETLSETEILSEGVL